MSLHHTQLRAAAKRRAAANAFTKLLLHCDGVNGSTSIIDSSASTRAITAQGATISTAQSKFGGASLSFGDTYATAAASSDWDFAGGDFTVEAFVYLTVSPTANYRPIIGNDNIGVTRGWLFLCDRDLAGALNFTIFTSNSTFLRVVSTGAFPQNVWKHIAACRAGNTLRLFIDGVLVATTVVTGAVCQNPAQPLAIGTLWGSSVAGPVASGRWSGYMDEIRVKKGEALYTSAFTPPTAPFTS